MILAREDVGLCSHLPTRHAFPSFKSLHPCLKKPNIIDRAKRIPLLHIRRESPRKGVEAYDLGRDSNRASLPNLRIWIRNDRPIRNVRIRPDKRNDQIESSPKEENRRHLDCHGTVAHFCRRRFYLPQYYLLIFFVDTRNIECPLWSPILPFDYSSVRYSL